MKLGASSGRCSSAQARVAGTNRFAVALAGADTTHEVEQRVVSVTPARFVVRPSYISADLWRYLRRRAMMPTMPSSRPARFLFRELFPGANAGPDSFGNALAATAFLQGLAAEELRRPELDYPRSRLRVSHHHKRGEVRSPRS
jgi:hypothetical protein